MSALDDELDDIETATGSPARTEARIFDLQKGAITCRHAKHTHAGKEA